MHVETNVVNWSLKQKKWFEKPYGMTLVEGGAFIMGKQDDDIAQLRNAPAKTVTVRSFYMDETEITNSEYRQFVWVRDSVALAMLARKADELNTGEEGGGEGIGEYAFKDTDTADMSPFQIRSENYIDPETGEPLLGRPLNWDQDIEWEPNSYVDLAYVEVMDTLLTSRGVVQR